MSDLTGLPEWTVLAAHRDEVAGVHLRELFAADPARGEAMAWDACDLRLDYSKNRMTAETLRLLIAVAEAAGVRARADAMFAGERINITEERAVLHVALRAPGARSIAGATADERRARRARGARAHARLLRARPQRRRGAGAPASRSRRSSTSASGAPTSVRRWRTRPSTRTPRPSIACRFVSNIDGADIAGRLRDSTPRRRCSSSPRRRSRTIETLTNATHGPGLALEAARRRCRRQALRRGQHQRREGGRVRHRHRTTCSGSGTGSAAATPSTRRSGWP